MMGIKSNPNQALGARIRDIRTGAGMTGDELADAAQRTGFGFRWDRSTITRIEKGERVLSWWELVNLPQVFAAAGYATSLKDLFDPPLAIRINGHTLAVGWDAIGGPPDGYSSLPERLRKPFTMTETERRAAKSLGVQPRVLDLLSWRRYGRRFVTERNERAAAEIRPDATTREAESARRWATRRMLAELRHSFGLAERRRLDGLSDAEFDQEQRRNGVD